MSKTPSYNLAKSPGAVMFYLSHKQRGCPTRHAAMIARRNASMYPVRSLHQMEAARRAKQTPPLVTALSLELDEFKMYMRTHKHADLPLETLHEYTLYDPDRGDCRRPNVHIYDMRELMHSYLELSEIQTSRLQGSKVLAIASSLSLHDPGKICQQVVNNQLELAISFAFHGPAVRPSPHVVCRTKVYRYGIREDLVDALGKSRCPGYDKVDVTTAKDLDGNIVNHYVVRNFRSTFWAETIWRLARDQQAANTLAARQLDINETMTSRQARVDDLQEAVTESIRGITAVQEFLASSSADGTDSQLVLAIHWSFSQARHGEVGSTSWRQIVLPGNESFSFAHQPQPSPIPAFDFARPSKTETHSFDTTFGDLAPQNIDSFDFNQPFDAFSQHDHSGPHLSHSHLPCELSTLQSPINFSADAHMNSTQTPADPHRHLLPHTSAWVSNGGMIPSTTFDSGDHTHNHAHSHDYDHAHRHHHDKVHSQSHQTYRVAQPQRQRQPQQQPHPPAPLPYPIAPDLDFSTSHLVTPYPISDTAVDTQIHVPTHPTSSSFSSASSIAPRANMAVSAPSTGTTTAGIHAPTYTPEQDVDLDVDLDIDVNLDVDLDVHLGLDGEMDMDLDLDLDMDMDLQLGGLDVGLEADQLLLRSYGVGDGVGISGGSGEEQDWAGLRMYDGSGGFYDAGAVAGAGFGIDVGVGGGGGIGDVGGPELHDHDVLGGNHLRSNGNGHLLSPNGGACTAARRPHAVHGDHVAAMVGLPACLSASAEPEYEHEHEHEYVPDDEYKPDHNNANEEAYEQEYTRPLPRILRSGRQSTKPREQGHKGSDRNVFEQHLQQPQQPQSQHNGLKPRFQDTDLRPLEELESQEKQMERTEKAPPQPLDQQVLGLDGFEELGQLDRFEQFEERCSTDSAQTQLHSQYQAFPGAIAFSGDGVEGLEKRGLALENVHGTVHESANESDIEGYEQGSRRLIRKTHLVKKQERDLSLDECHDEGHDQRHDQRHDERLEEYRFQEPELVQEEVQN